MGFIDVLIAMSELVCRACGRPISPNEKYVGFRRPTGFSVMCTSCYESNGGNSSKIRKRYSGSALDYYEQNLKGVRGTQLIRERAGHLTPEQRERREEFATEVTEYTVRGRSRKTVNEKN